MLFTSKHLKCNDKVDLKAKNINRCKLLENKIPTL